MNFPHVLYRAFETHKYADAFTKIGKFRMGALRTYKQIENSNRRDSTEGDGHYIDGKGVNAHFQLGNDVYVLSCSKANVDLKFLREKFGRYVVRINKPSRLASDIRSYMEQRGICNFGGVKGISVTYTKGAVVTEDLDPMGRAKLSISQKHRCFSKECEYRFYTILNQNPLNPKPLPEIQDGYLTIDLARELSYVEVLGEGT
ncbi:MAG: hypothetical protein MN733_12200 [Nitrososphaera sp.]|nr:hypothetical protein [Nitrososphaera sp.]